MKLIIIDSHLRVMIVFGSIFLYYFSLPITNAMKESSSNSNNADLSNVYNENATGARKESNKDNKGNKDSKDIVPQNNLKNMLNFDFTSDECIVLCPLYRPNVDDSIDSTATSASLLCDTGKIKSCLCTYYEMNLNCSYSCIDGNWVMICNNDTNNVVVDQNNNNNKNKNEDEEEIDELEENEHKEENNNDGSFGDGTNKNMNENEDGALDSSPIQENKQEQNDNNDGGAANNDNNNNDKKNEDEKEDRDSLSEQEDIQEEDKTEGNGSLRVGDDKNNKELEEKEEVECLAAAGYIYCTELNKCIRPFETACPLQGKEVTTTIVGRTISTGEGRLPTVIVCSNGKCNLNVECIIPTMRGYSIRGPYISGMNGMYELPEECDGSCAGCDITALSSLSSAYKVGRGLSLMGFLFMTTVVGAWW